MTKVPYPDHHHFSDIYYWCENNCKGQYHHGHNWDYLTWQHGAKNRMVEFENEQDAIIFSLRWL